VPESVSLEIGSLSRTIGRVVNRLSRGVTWLEPTVTVELTYSELMEGRLRDPGYRGLV
jgi:hypothetical protein